MSDSSLFVKNVDSKRPFIFEIEYYRSHVKGIIEDEDNEEIIEEVNTQT